jgi:6-phosphofructokinase 1
MVEIMKKANPKDYIISNLGECKIKSPVIVNYFTSDSKRLILKNYIDYNDSSKNRSIKEENSAPLSVEVAGPREKIFFDPSKTKAAIVTCGGLCPGINDVIRAIVMEFYHRYGVRNIIGIKYGFQGLIPSYGNEIVELTPELVENIHREGGSILSSSRGQQNIGEMVDALVRMNVSILFCIGGDGTMRAAEHITEEITKRQLSISLIGIPKTIDNDLNFVQKTFGFDTAIAESVKAIACAHIESRGAPMGIGLVKIMGRLSGQIAVGAALAQNDVNFVLIPEVPFQLEGDKGLFKALEKRLKERKHCVILVAEGAGQELMRKNNTSKETDASGNIRLLDIGFFLKTKIEEYFKRAGIEINLKYIDPSYMIRSVPASASDGIYCSALGQYAVHAGMAGKTGMLVGLMKDEYVHLPIRVVTSGKQIDPGGNLWMRVLESTGQPPTLTDN